MLGMFRLVSKCKAAKNAPVLPLRYFSAMTVPGPLVTADWLASNLACVNGPSDSNVRVLDATMFLPNEPQNGREQFLKSRIPSASYFDIDTICDKSSPFPHMLPSPAEFSEAVADIGVGRDNAVVVYDAKGIFSAPRVAWMMKVFGHDNVAVLDGGMPAWVSAGYPVESGEFTSPARAGAPLPVLDEPDRSMIVSFEDVERCVLERGLVDARSEGRFKGTAAEPRPGLPAGHIVGSVNIPITDVLNADGTMKSPDDLRDVFHQRGITASQADGAPTHLPVASCGSGVTACVIHLAASRAFPSSKGMPVYDGSWTEWATRVVTPNLAQFAKSVQALSAEMDDFPEFQKQLAAVADSALRMEYSSAAQFIDVVSTSPSDLGLLMEGHSSGDVKKLFRKCVDDCRALTEADPRF